MFQKKISPNKKLIEKKNASIKDLKAFKPQQKRILKEIRSRSNIS